MTYTCIICGEVLKTEAIPALGHTKDEGRITKEPTCVDEGAMTYTCIICGEELTESIPATGDHVYEKGECVVCGKAQYVVGDIGPAGGYIFYDKGSYSDGWRYLEAAPSDIGKYALGDNKVERTSTELGTGKKNTEIIASISTFYKENAAKACLDYSVNGYDDWFLPSKDELNLLFKLLFNPYVNGLAQYYWSSSGVPGNAAWRQDFINGRQSYADRSYGYKVRPVRAF